MENQIIETIESQTKLIDELSVQSENDIDEIKIDQINKSNTQKGYYLSQLNSTTFNVSDYVDKDEKLIEIIKNNKNELENNKNVLWNIYKKLIPKEKMLRDIITYEFLYDEPQTKYSNIDEIVKIALHELKKYQGVIGGFYIEDNEWIESTENTRFKSEENRKMIYNTIETKLCYEINQISFLKNFTKRMKKYVENKSILVDYKIIDDERHEICWVLFVFEKKNSF